MAKEMPTPVQRNLLRRPFPNPRSVVKAGLDPLIGSIALKKYRIISRLAKGGMSTIYLVRDITSSSRYALKVLKSAFAGDSKIKKRFILESKAAKMIIHPNVAKIYEAGTLKDGRLCLLMEYITGKTLRRILDMAPVEQTTTISILTQIAQALKAAHDNGVIHRDLKPENILLVPAKNGPARIKLVDFGIARILDSPHITTTNHIMGTPHYISPEQAMGAHIDHLADIYAFGVIAYEMLAGSLPFYSDNPQQLMRHHLQDLPPPLKSFKKINVSDNLNKLVMQCLSKPPWKRPADMTEVLKKLSKC